MKEFKLTLAAILFVGFAGHAQADAFTINSSGPNLDPNLSYSTVGGPFSLVVGGGRTSIIEGKFPDQITTLAFLTTNFTVNGDFIATLTGDFTGIQDTPPSHQICNLCGNQEVGVFQANFLNGGVANVFGVGDEGGFFLGNNIDNNVQRGIPTNGGHWLQTFRIERSGNTVTVATLDGAPGNGNPFIDRQSFSAADLAGPVAFEFYFENGNNNPYGGSIDVLAFNVSANQIEGLVESVPEPQSYAMLLAGLGLVGFIVRRRKSSARN